MESRNVARDVMTNFRQRQLKWVNGKALVCYAIADMTSTDEVTAA
jgi:hypothetical protein